MKINVNGYCAKKRFFADEQRDNRPAIREPVLPGQREEKKFSGRDLQPSDGSHLVVFTMLMILASCKGDRQNCAIL
jgi:hypothetical protein